MSPDSQVLLFLPYAGKLSHYWRPMHQLWLFFLQKKTGKNKETKYTWRKINKVMNSLTMINMCQNTNISYVFRIFLKFRKMLWCCSSHDFILIVKQTKLQPFFHRDYSFWERIFTKLWCDFESANQQRLFKKSMSRGGRLQSPIRATCTVILSKWWVHFSFFGNVFTDHFPLFRSNSTEWIQRKVIWVVILLFLLYLRPKSLYIWCECGHLFWVFLT